MPPPAATPWMAATTGFGDASISSRIAGRCAAPGGGGALNSRMSAPPQNIRSAPAMTIRLDGLIGQRLGHALAQRGAHGEAQAVDGGIRQAQQSDVVVAFERDGTGHA